MRYFAIIAFLIALGAGCQTTTTPETNQPTQAGHFKWNDAKISFEYPKEWGMAKITETNGETWNDQNQITPAGSTFKVDLEKFLICGSTTDYSAPRGSYYCDSHKTYEYKNGKYYFDDAAVKPFKIINISDGKILVLNSSSVACEGPVCTDFPGQGEYFAIVNLKGNKYPVAIFAFKEWNDGYENLLKSISLK